MKRHLILMRHAKSSWKEPGQEDHARPLNKRGRRDAPRVAERLVELGWTPQRVLLSDAARTRETWSLMRAAFQPAPAVEERPDLYLAGLERIRAGLAKVPAGEGTVLVLGHNPGWEDAVSSLVGQPISMTTANAALLEGQGPSWAEALDGAWRLVEVVRPKELPGGDAED